MIHRCRFCLRRLFASRGLCGKCSARRQRLAQSHERCQEAEELRPQIPAPLPPCATNAAPGSPQKLLVMMMRAAQRQQLFHPDDATFAAVLNIA